MWALGSTVLVLALNSVRMALYEIIAPLKLVYWEHMLGPVGTRLALMFCLALAGCFLYRFRSVVPSLAKALLLILAPLLPLNVSLAFWQCAQQHGVNWTEQRPEPTMRVPTSQRRVVWILFDEWDYRLTFEARPHGLRLPTFDRLMKTSYSASQAAPPGARTTESVISLFLGRQASSVRVNGVNSISYQLAGSGNWHDLTVDNTLWQALTSKGLSTSLVGWYFPYCRFFGSKINSCAWFEASFSGFPEFAGLLSTVGEQARSLASTQRFSLLGRPLGYSKYLTTHFTWWNAALAAARNPRHSVVFLHCPILHAPYYYNDATGQFDLPGSPLRGYFGALRLADAFLARLTNELANAGLEHNTLLVLTGDHSLRSAAALGIPRDMRVPLLIHSTNTANMELSYPLSTIALRFVIEEYVASASDLKQLVHRYLGPSQPPVPELPLSQSD